MCAAAPFILFAAGCAETTVVTSRLHDENRSCFADSASDRWSPAGPLQLTDIQIDSGAGFDLGLAGSASWLYMFDYRMGHIIVADSLNRKARTFARPGHGPGDILPVGAISHLIPKGRRADWIDVTRDTIAVLDGFTVHWYRPDGTLIRDARRGLAKLARGPLPLMSSRIRRFGDHDLLDTESVGPAIDGSSSRSTGREFSIWSVDADAGTLVFRLQLAPLPLRKNGVAYPYLGVDEAQGLWDLHGECIVATDGGSPHLYVRRVGSDPVDTISLLLPEAIPRAEGDEEELMRKLGSPGPIPDPAVPKRFWRFVVDPDGWAWIVPNPRLTESRHIEVLRVHVASGRVRGDTVPAFPLVFRSDGSYVGVRVNEETGAVRVVHIRHREG